MRGFVLCFLAIGVTSAASSTSGPVTMDQLNKVIEKLQANPQYVPAFVADPIVHFTEQEKQQFVNFLNEWNKGEINVTDKFQLLKSLQENAPTLVPTLLNMYITYSEKLSKVDPGARAYTIEWVNEFIALTKHRYNIPLLMQKAKQFFDGLRHLSFGDAATFAGQFPEIAHLLVAAPSVQKLRNFTDKLPDNSEAYKVGSF
ncbi:hypothetical protein COOONC_17057 [Cooperia oncophora]